MTLPASCTCELRKMSGQSWIEDGYTALDLSLSPGATE